MDIKILLKYHISEHIISIEYHNIKNCIVFSKYYNNLF